MSSLIDVLKEIQNEYDLESRTEARSKFDELSGAFERSMAAAFPDEKQVQHLAGSESLMAEYWMNQWVGSNPEWHGDWGKMLRKAVRELKAEAEAGFPGDGQGEVVRDEAAYQENLAAQQRATETAPGEETVQHGTVQVGKNKFDAVRSLVDQSITYRTKSGERKIFPGQRVYSTWSQSI